MNDDKKYEKMGEAIFSLSYLFYALKFIFVVSAVALAVLHFIHKPLIFAPVVGVAVFLVYRFIRRIIVRIFFKLSKME